MNRDLKDIVWITNYWNLYDISPRFRRRGMVCLNGRFDIGRKEWFDFHITNFVKKYEKIYYDPNKFFFSFNGKKYKETFSTLEETKEFAENECRKKFIDLFFKPPIKRQLIIEKCKKSTKPTIKKRNKKLPEPAEVIDLRETHINKNQKKDTNLYWSGPDLKPKLSGDNLHTNNELWNQQRMNTIIEELSKEMFISFDRREELPF